MTPVFLKTLFYVRENYFDKRRLRWPLMFLHGLQFVQWDTPEVMVEHWYDSREPWVTVRVNTTARKFSLQSLSAAWELAALMKEVLGFIQDNLLPVSPDEEGRRLLRIEMAATNGMLYALDPHSVLLDAETYQSMRARPHGLSGGVGLSVIRADNDDVEVTQMVENGPGALAGLVVGDRLVRVDDLAVRHMNLDDVIDHLRGGAGSTVRLTISHGGKERTVPVTRDFVRVPSVAQQRVLKTRLTGADERSIGYIKLDHFAVDASSSVADALTALAKERVQGLVLDLRGNKGGLYEQAVKVADAFLKRGRIVAMVAPGDRRKEENADDSGNEPAVPVVVLVDHASAAASEIVAAALKERDRAVVVGEKTFGEGSVQVLFDIPSPLSRASSDKLGLKLTTAQWVSPANTSIQGMGLTPDIALSPERVSDVKGEPPLQLEATATRSEAEYAASLGGLGAPSDGHSFATLPFVSLPARDFALDFARDLLASIKSSSRTPALQESKPFVERARADEDRRLVAILSKRKIDWTPGARRSAEGRLELDMSTRGPVPGPGENVIVRGVVKNNGTVPLHRVRAVVKMQGLAFGAKELTFGAIEPGQSQASEIEIRVPAGAPPSSHLISADASCDECGSRTHSELVTKTGGRAPPVFSISYETADAPAPLKQLVVKVQNIGTGPAKDVVASLRSAPGQEDVAIDVGFFRTEHIDSRKGATFSFVYEDQLDSRPEPYRFDLLVGEAKTDNMTIHRISFEGGGAGAAAGHVTPPIVTASAPPEVHSLSVRVTGEASSEGGLRDLFVTVQTPGSPPPSRKVFYLAATGGSTRLPFTADVPLELGSNALRVTARGLDGVATTYPLSVLVTRSNGTR